MEGVTALRDAAREAILRAGGRGFVRFLAQGDALLISDAPRRCQNEEEIARLTDALAQAGFICKRNEQDLLEITPDGARLLALCAAQPGEIAVDWNEEDCGAQALCARLLRETPQALTKDGCALVLHAARLLWQPREKALAGLPALRARIAAQLREGRRDGLHEAGRLLCGWLAQRESKEALR